MTRHHTPSPEDRFNDYLDALASGRSTPDASDFSAGTNAEPSIPDDAARELHDLARAADSRQGRPPEQLWEIIMHEGSASPGSASIDARTAPSAEIPTTSNTHASAVRMYRNPIRKLRSSSRLHSSTLNIIANAALILFVLLAGFTGYRLLQETGTTPPSSPAASSRIVLGSPSPGAAVSPPNTKTIPESSCSMSKDIPIFRGKSTTWPGTALHLTPQGDLIVMCPEQSEPVTVARGVDRITPMAWHATARLDMRDHTTSIINLQAGLLRDFGDTWAIEFHESDLRNPIGGYFDVFNERFGSPWLVTPAGPQLTDWRITDLRTMESHLLSEFANGQLVHSRAVIVSTNGNDDTAIITVRPAFDDDHNPINESRIPGTSLVLPGGFDGAHWLDLQHTDGVIDEVALSIDGTHVASKQVSADGTTVISLTRVKDGTEVVQSDPYQNSGPFQMTWVNGGDALAYLDQGTLMVLPANSQASAKSLFEVTAESLPARLRTTSASNVVLLWSKSGGITSVNTENGETTVLPGVDLGPYSELYQAHLQPVRYVVTSTITDNDPEQQRFMIVDAVTAEIVYEVRDVRVSVWAPQEHRISSSATGDIMVVSFDATRVFVVEDSSRGPVIVLQIPSTWSESASQPIPQISPDGSLLALSSSPDDAAWVGTITGPSMSWTPIAQANQRVFLAGTGT